MSDRPPQPVLVGTDGSGPATLAVSWAAEEARLRGAMLKLCVVEEPARPGSEPAGDVLERALTVATLDAPDLPVEPTIRHGDPAQVLTELAGRAQLTVVGHRGAAARPFAAMGSAAFTLSRACPSPLVVIRFAPGRPVPDRARPVLVALDGSEADAVVVEHAAAVAATRNATLQAVHVWTEHLDDVVRRLGHRERRSAREAGERLLDEATAGLADRFPGLEVVCTVVRGRPAWSLLELSDSAQLVVIGGVRGRRYGLCTGTLVQAAGCPVAVVPVAFRPGRAPAVPLERAAQP